MIEQLIHTLNNPVESDYLELPSINLNVNLCPKSITNGLAIPYIKWYWQRSGKDLSDYYYTASQHGDLCQLK